MAVMAIGDNYITVAQVKRWMNITGADKDDIIQDVVTAITDEIDTYCCRQFNDSGAVTARVYDPIDRHRVIVDDFWTTTGLIIATDDDNDGVFENVWDATDYEVRPLNGVRYGRPGWPYWEIRPRPFTANTQRFHRSHVANIQVTAQWGWQAVPNNVIQAGKMLAADVFQLKDNRLGLAGSDEFGHVIRVRDNVIARAKLDKYARGKVRLG